MNSDNGMIVKVPRFDELGEDFVGRIIKEKFISLQRVIYGELLIEILKFVRKHSHVKDHRKKNLLVSVYRSMHHLT